MRLIDACELIVDCPHSTAIDEGVGFPLIRTPNIGKGKLKLVGVHRVSEEVYNSRNARAIPQRNDLIFAREAPAGNVALIRDEIVCLGQRTVLIRPNQKIVNPLFLTYYLLGPEMQHKLLKTANGSTVDHVNMSIIRKVDIDIPKLDYQEKVGSILNRYDELIDVNNKRIEKCIRLASEIYRNKIIKNVLTKKNNTKSVKPKGWTINDNELLYLPQGWEYEPLEKIAKFIRGKNITSSEMNEGTIPVIAGGVEPSGYHSVSNVNGVSITASASGYAGYCSIHYSDIWAADCSYVDSKSTKYIFFVYESLKYIQEYLYNLQHGAAQQHVNANDLNKVKIIIPDKQHLKELDNEFMNIHTYVSKIEKANGELENKKCHLLSKLMLKQMVVK